MRAHLAKLWDSLRSSYWFLPSLMATVSIAIAFGMVSIDHLYNQHTFRAVNWIAPNDVESARALLATIATSMISVASLVFSITIVTLTLASSQFGPRLLYTFMRDRTNQLVLGVFVSTFLYCLLVLTMTQQRTTGEGFVPKLSILVALGLAIASIGVLIFFIHHIAESIQAPVVAASVSRDLRQAIESFMPPHPDDADQVEASPDHLLPGGREDSVLSNHEGYLQTVDVESLVDAARHHDVVMRMRCRPGDFLFEGTPLISVYLRQQSEVPQSLQATIHTAFVMGSRRTAVQDIEFALNQLVEVAVRSLSPGINDPFTAITCIERLAAAMTRCAQRGNLPTLLRDKTGEPRLFLDTTSFAGLLNAAFDQIRQHGRTDVAVSIRLLEAFTRIAHFARTTEQCDALQEQAESVHEHTAGTIDVTGDSQDLQRRYDQARAVIARRRRAITPSR